MTAKRANIIGSGVAGLVLGGLLSKEGYEVHLYEQNSDIGGVTGGFSRNGYYWDLGQLILEGMSAGEQAGKVFDELGIRDKLTLIPADRIYDFPDFTIKPPKEYGGPWWRRDFFIEQFPQEEKGIRQYYRYYQRMMEIVSLAREGDKLSGLPALLCKIKMYLRLLPLLPKSKWSGKQLMDHFFEGPEMKAALTSILADFVVMPEEFQGLGVALVNPEPAFDQRVPLRFSPNGVQPSYTYIDGGCRALVNLLAEVVREQGGQMHVNSQVTAIKSEAGRVTGIELADGTFHPADVVVPTCGARETFEDMLGAQALDEEYRAILDDLPLMESIFMLQLGLDVDPREHLGSAVVYYIRTYDISGSVDKLKNGVYHEGEDGYLICSPSWYSPQNAPEGKHALTIYTVSPDTAADFAWDDRKEYLADRLLELAEEHFPDLRKHIVEQHILTPQDFRAITLQKHHAFGGCAPVMNRKAAPFKTPVEGLWFAGSQSESGAGINNVVEGAWKVAGMIVGEGF